ncbi:hypothetical protein J4401_02990, partial [Candidatus Woesearchaeota archaeon]|nr:hypothetical protein [Candidatus Woesearchaeota archaeon]
GGSQAFVLTKKDDRRVGADNIAILPDGGRTEAVNKGGQTLNKEYLPNGEFKESHLVIAGQDILPFNSEKWTLSETKDGKRELSYNGKKVDETKIDKINKKLEFEDGSYVREFDGGLLVEQKATGETVITERGKKPITLSKKDAEKILKNDKAVLTTSYVANLDDMLDIAEKARVPTSSLEWDGKDSLVSKDVRITAHAGGAAYEKGTFDKGVLDTSKPFTKVDYVMVDGKPVVQKTEILEKDAKAPSVVIWDEKNDVVEVDGQKFTITKDKNVVMFCDGDKCIDLDNSQTYKKTDKGFDRCGKECDELEKKMKKHIEERRVKSGGQKNSERRMTGLFNILETSQTGLGKVFSLFMKEEDKIEWQVKLDKFLCDSYILGGKDCWTSQICSSYIDKIPDSILLIESPTGVQISALVSGVRQEISYAERGTGKKEYVYKLSFAVKNKKDSGRKIRFNVRLEGDKNILLYDTYQEVEEGSIFSRSGKKVIIKESDSFYNKICILFPDGVTKPGEGIINELCNSIVPSPDIGAEQGSTQGNNEGEPEGGEADF